MEEQELHAAAGQPGGIESAPASEKEGEADSGEAAGGDSAEEVEQALFADQLLSGDQQATPPAPAGEAELKAVLEAIVYVLNEPVPAEQIAQALDRPVSEVEPILRQLAEETGQPGRGIFIRKVAGGYQMATKPEHHEILRNFVKNLKQPLKLSQAALETLAVIAYKQPITMPEILEIRGVQGGGVVKTLLDRKLITTAGRKNVIGKPILYRTTKDFLTQFGLRDVSELPSLKEFEEIRRQSIADEEMLPLEAEGAPPQEPPQGQDGAAPTGSLDSDQGEAGPALAPGAAEPDAGVPDTPSEDNG